MNKCWWLCVEDKVGKTQKSSKKSAFFIRRVQSSGLHSWNTLNYGSILPFIGPSIFSKWCLKLYDLTLYGLWSKQTCYNVNNPLHASVLVYKIIKEYKGRVQE